MAGGLFRNYSARLNSWLKEIMVSYFDIDLEIGWEEKAIKESVHRFALEVMRPAARTIDRMTAEDAVGPASPIWNFLTQAYAHGYHKAGFPIEFGGLGFTPIQTHIMTEELNWGSVGLAGVLLLCGWPYIKLLHTGNRQLIEKYVIPFCKCEDASLTGCWGIIEPDHGSDQLSIGEDYYTDPKIKNQVRAKLDGDDWVINGQKAAWVSCGPIASHAMLNVQIDSSKGLAGGGVCFLPLNIDGVSRGKPLEKVGQRDLPQGELFFDDVRIPKDHMFIMTEEYPDSVVNNLGFGNSAITLFALGLARAAFEEALAYVKDRIQGGRPLVEQYSMKIRIHRMFAKVEAIRAMSRAVWKLNLTVYPPLGEYAYAAKVFCTEAAREVVDEAVQIHGANGLTKEYFVEKLWRDSRALTIEDGENDVLARLGGHILKDTYPRVRESVRKVS
jgi:alkylation response protein AidB-like acyl-CoA dehydrogenase